MFKLLNYGNSIARVNERGSALERRTGSGRPRSEGPMASKLSRFEPFRLSRDRKSVV